METSEIAHNHKLDPRELRPIENMNFLVPNQWMVTVQQNMVQTLIGSWVGCFERNEQSMPLEVVFKVVISTNQYWMSVVGHPFTVQFSNAMTFLETTAFDNHLRVA